MTEPLTRCRVYDHLGQLMASFPTEADALHLVELLREKGHVAEIRVETLNPTAR